MSASGKTPLILFFIVVFAGAMALGPLLYFALDGQYAFHRTMERALLFCALAALVLYRSRIPLGKLWPRESGAWKQLLYGWAVALVSAQAMFGLNLAVIGMSRVPMSAGAILGRVFIALVAALIVPLLEETLFRGFLQTELIERFGLRPGWLLAAALYALAHFITPPSGLDHQPVHVWSGITAVGSTLAGLGHGSFLCGKGLNLFLIGLIFGGCFLRSGTLWFNAGLHGGWIFTLLLLTGLTRPLAPPAVPWLAGDLISNPLTTVVLVLLSVWLWRFYQPHFIAPGTGENAP